MSDRKEARSVKERAELQRQGYRLLATVIRDGRNVWIMVKDDTRTTKAEGQCRK